MQDLICLGLCTEDERSALERWPGQMDPGPLLPVWRQGLAPNSNRIFLTIHRKISHFKLLVGADGNMEAKAYVEFARLARPLTARTPP